MVISMEKVKSLHHIAKLGYGMRVLLALMGCFGLYLVLYPLGLMVGALKHVFRRPRGVLWVEDALLTWFFQGICFFFSVQVKVCNPNPWDAISRDQPVIFMSNHVSMFDIPILYQVLPKTLRMIAMKEVFAYPLPGFALIMRMLGFIGIDATGQCGVKESYQEATRALVDWQVPLWVSPEGQLSNDDQLQAFKSGVFRLAQQTHAVIIPLVISGSSRVLPKADWLQLRPRFGQQVQVHFGDPVDAKCYQTERMQLKSAVWHQMHGLINIAPENT